MMALFVKNLLMVSVILMMLSVGLRTAIGEVIDIAKQYQLVIRGVLANFLVVPLIFYLAVQWLPFRPHVVIALMIMAAVPIAPMAPPLVGMAKGDVIYAVGLMTIVALLCVPLTPLLLALCLPATEKGLDLNILKIIGTILKVQLIPICLGMAINHVSRTWTEKLLKFVPKVSQVGLVICIILIVSVNGKQIVNLGLLPNLAVLLSIIVTLFIGDWMMIGETTGRRRSLAISTAIRNVALGLLIVNNNFPGTLAVALVLVYAILSMVVAFAYGKLMAAKEIRSSHI